MFTCIHSTAAQTIQKVLKYWRQNIQKYTIGLYDEASVKLAIL